MRHGALPLEPLARSYAVTHPTGTIDLHPAPGWSLVVYATRGVLAVVADGNHLTVPAHRAALLPDGARLQLQVIGRTSLRNLYVQSRLRPLTDRARVVDVGPLARELLLEAVRRAPLHRRDPAARRLLATLLDELDRLPDTPLQLPMPTDPGAAAVAAALLADPTTTLSLDVLAHRAGLGRRTLERRFRQQTGMSPAHWRTRARLVASVRALADGATTAAAASTAGFATSSAFVAAFRRQLGTTPSQFVRIDRPMNGDTGGRRP